MGGGVDDTYPNGMSVEEWVSHCRKRQREMFRGDGELLHYTTVEPTTASIAELLMAKGMKIA